MMRTLLALLTLSLFASSASASLLLYEGFDYPAGEEINGQVNPFSGQTWSKPPVPAGNTLTALISSTGLDYPGLPAGVGNSLSLPRETQSNISRITIPGGPYTYDGDDTSLFFSFAMKMTDWVTTTDEIAASANHRNGDFIAGFTASGAAGGMSGANVYAGQVRIRRELDEFSIQTGRYELGFHKNNLIGGADFIEWDETQSFEVDQTVFLVGEYQFGTEDVFDDIVRLWINPVPGEAAGTPSVVVTNGYDVSTASGQAQGAINSFWFRDGNTFLPGPVLVDELRIGTSFASVTPADLVAVSADFNGDGVIDGSDFLIWQRGFGISDGTAVPSNGDATGDGNVNADDLAVWESQFGTVPATVFATAVPEPGSVALMLFAFAAMSLRRIH